MERSMTSHDLARVLLESPDLPVATHSNNHTFTPSPALGCLMVGLMEARKADGSVLEFILIGNFDRMQINYPNEYVRTILAGDDIPLTWARP